jgi:hypothetical protein
LSFAPHQIENNIITGVKVSRSLQIFVTVPRWRTGVPSSLNLVVKDANGLTVLKPWPSWEFNAQGMTNKLQYAQSMWITSNEDEVMYVNFEEMEHMSVTIHLFPSHRFWVSVFAQVDPRCRKA